MNAILTLHGNLVQLLKMQYRSCGSTLHLPVDRRASIKDLLESLGIPHPELERLHVNEEDVSFAHIVQSKDRIEAWPLSPPVDFTLPTVLRPEPLHTLHFLVDANVGRLARYLRMAGFDTFFQPSLQDRDLAEIACREKRIVLTRDRGLLRRKIISFGHLIRNETPEEQLREVVRLFSLAKHFAPFTRCMRCNGLLHPVAKEEIINHLEPLTKKYYDSFTRCDHCAAIYWPGSHRKGMERIFRDLKQERYHEK